MEGRGSLSGPILGEGLAGGRFFVLPDASRAKIMAFSTDEIYMEGNNMRKLEMLSLLVLIIHVVLLAFQSAGKSSLYILV